MWYNQRAAHEGQGPIFTPKPLYANFLILLAASHFAPKIPKTWLNAALTTVQRGISDRGTHMQIFSSI
jgi:hypothetical protein